MMKTNRTGFSNRLNAPWGVWGLSVSLFGPPRSVRPPCNPANAQFCGDRIAINHEAAADSEAIAFGTATNVAPIDDGTDDWINVSPYGEFPNDEGLQVVDRPAADEMVATFNSFIAKLGRLFRGLPIFKGHPDARPDIWPDDARYGRINELEARNDGLYGKVAWNDLGQKNKEQGYYVYPSPAWNFKRVGAGKIKPFRLKSIGLTNNPNIFESVPLTNAKLSAASAESQTTTTKGNQMPKWLITALVAANVLTKPAEGQEPTEEQVQTALNAVVTERTTLTTNVKTEKTAKETAETALNTAQAEAKKFKKLCIDHELDLAVNDGRLSAAERPQWATKFETDFDAAAKDLKEKQAALNTKPLSLSPSGKDLSDASKRRIAFNSRLDELMRPDRDGKSLTLDQAINSMRGSAEDRALLEAMQQPLAA